MRIREGVDEDGPDMAELLDIPSAIVDQLLRERAVRVAETDDTLVGVLAYDARPGTVHITQIAGDETAVGALLDEPVRFARAEGMAVEIVLPHDAAEISAVETAGFQAVGPGPTFDGEATTRYRFALD